MITIKSDTADNLVYAVAHGKVTAEDYEVVFIPAIDAKLRSQKKIRVLYQLGDEFSGLTAGAIWDDAKLNLTHLTAFERVAIVTDVHWILESVEFLSFFIPCQVRVYTNDKLMQARTWVEDTVCDLVSPGRY